MAAKKKSSRRYGKKASEKVEEKMHEMKQGTLRSGGSGKKVTNPKQAVAIGLSEARREGAKVPPDPSDSADEGSSKKRSSKKSASKKSASKKSASKKAASKKSASKKKSSRGASKKK